MSSNPQSSTQIATPCIGVCQFDHERQVCIGCGRTLEHIGNWARYSQAERLAIMETLQPVADQDDPGAPDVDASGVEEPAPDP